MSQYPAYPPRQSNGFGLAGFILSLLGLLGTCGLLCPLGLLFSLIGLRKQPRGFAIAGVILGLIGCFGAILFFLVFGGLAFLLTCGGVAVAFAPQFVTQFRMDEAARHVERFHDAHARFPTTLHEALQDRPGYSSRDTLDAWNHNLHYTTSMGGAFTITSSGPDGLPGNADDLTRTGNVKN